MKEGSNMDLKEMVVNAKSAINIDGGDVMLSLSGNFINIVQPEGLGKYVRLSYGHQSKCFVLNQTGGIFTRAEAVEYGKELVLGLEILRRLGKIDPRMIYPLRNP